MLRCFRELGAKWEKELEIVWRRGQGDGVSEGKLPVERAIERLRLLLHELQRQPASPTTGQKRGQLDNRVGSSENSTEEADSIVQSAFSNVESERLD